MSVGDSLKVSEFAGFRIADFWIMDAQSRIEHMCAQTFGTQSLLSSVQKVRQERAEKFV